MKAFQEYYSEEFSHCYGCGTAHPTGFKVKSYWLDEQAGTTIAHFTPDEQFTGGFPQNVYGGLIVAILDCHGNGTAYAAGYKHFGRTMGSAPHLRYVTANLNLNFLAPTPIGERLELRGNIKEVTYKKVVMELQLWAKEKLRVSGTMVSVLLPPK